MEFSRALVVVAHPDDAEFWAGGTVAAWAAAGVSVSYLVLTDGEAGLPPGSEDRARRVEQDRAAQVLGVEKVRYLGRPEGSLTTPGPTLHVDLVREIRRTRPDRVVTWSPEWNWNRFRSCHPDHLATGAHTARAIYPDAGNPYALPGLLNDEGLHAWTVQQFWLLNSPQVNHYVDITDSFDCKVRAVQAHASQIADPGSIADSLRHRIAENTAAADLPMGRLAEAFQVVSTG
jgi:LmbE family N-acetylglucosaminyl deacetylase